MKKLIAPLIILATAFSLASAAHAQAAGPTGVAQTQTQTATTGHKAHPNQRKMVEEALAKLNLSADQKDKVKALYTKNQAALKDLRQQVKAGTLQKPDAAKKRQELNKETTKSLKEILTKDQAKQFAALMKEARAKAKEEKGGATTTTSSTGATGTTGSTGTKGGGN